MQVYNQLIWIAHGKQGYLETKKKSPGALQTPTLTLEPLEGPYKVRVVLLMKCLRHCYEDLKIGLSAAWVYRKQNWHFSLDARLAVSVEDFITS